MWRLQYGWVSSSAYSTSHSSWARVLAGAWLKAVISQNEGLSLPIHHAATHLAALVSLASLPQSWPLIYFSHIFFPYYYYYSFNFAISTPYLFSLHLDDSCCIPALLPELEFFFFFPLSRKPFCQGACRGHDPTTLCRLTGRFWLDISSPLKPLSF